MIGPSAGALGTFWWRWGDLEGDLAGKKFRGDEWFEGEGVGGDQGGEGSQVLERCEEGWVESEDENGFGLTMDVENEAEVEFM